MSRCRDCGHTIVWVVMRSGKKAPVAPNPDDRGTIVATRARNGQLVNGHHYRTDDGLLPGERCYVHHRAVCPHPKHLPKARPVPEVTTQPVLI